MHVYGCAGMLETPAPKPFEPFTGSDGNIYVLCSQECYESAALLPLPRGIYPAVSLS